MKKWKIHLMKYTNILPNKNISNEENKKEDFTNGLIATSCYYHNNNN